MAGISETGHVKNVANFDTLIVAIAGYGGAYNPSKSAIEPVNMGTILQAAGLNMSEVNMALSRNSITIAAREQAFTSLSSLSTRILNAVGACGVSEQIFNATRSLVHKLQGRRATPRLTAVEKATLAAAGETTTEISSSQMGFINRIDFLDKLIQLLFVMPEYSPNEEDLKPVNLINYYNLLKSTNSQALATENQLDIARASRNETLYRPVEGMVDTAKAAKMYIKSLFGAQSAQYKHVSGLVFRGIKIGASQQFVPQPI